MPNLSDIIQAKVTEINTVYTQADILGDVATYADISSMPLSNVSTGKLALAEDTGVMYLWNGSGWYKIATTAP